MSGLIVDIMIMIHARFGVIEANVNDSATIEVSCWKKDSCRVRRSMGLIASVLCACCKFQLDVFCTL